MDGKSGDETHEEINRLRAVIEDMKEQAEESQVVIDLLREENKRLQHIERSFVTWLNLLSHEVHRHALSVVGYASILKEDADCNQELSGQINKIIDGVKLLTGIFERLKILSKTGKVVINPEALNLSHIIKTVCDVFQLVGENLDISMIKDLTVCADEIWMIQLCTNLVGNAFKCQNPTEDLRIQVSYLENEDFFTILVRDNGIGIPKDNLERIFQPGYSGSGKSTGLGLALCRKIIEAHGGQMWAKSAGEGKGATFFFTLPKI